MTRRGILMKALGLFLFAQLAHGQWTAARRLTWNSGYSVEPRIAIRSFGDPHVVWSDFTPGNWELFCLKSADGGATWGTSQRLTWTATASADPAMAVDFSGNLHVVYYDALPGKWQIYYKKSTDGGVHWTASQRLTWTSGWADCPDISTSYPGNLHVVWEDNTPGNSEIYYRNSTDKGITWSTVTRLSWNVGDSYYPAIAVDSSGDLHVVWEDNTPGKRAIYYKKSTDGGATWAASQRLTWSSVETWTPSIAADSSGNLHVVWGEDTPGYSEVYYKRSTDGGATWETSRRLTWTAGNSNEPEIAADPSGNLHVVWGDNLPGNPEVYYKKSPDGGSSWGPTQRLTWSSGDSWHPKIAADSSGNLHVVWDDDITGNDEIYYKKFVN